MFFLHTKTSPRSESQAIRRTKSNPTYAPDAWYENVLGPSLEIRLVPPKTCPGACIYCPFGETTHQTIDRTSFCPTEEILHNVAKRVSAGETIKSVVIGGPGEPTLHADLGNIINRVKRMTAAPLSVAACGGLLWMPSVQRSLQQATSVFVNIDAADKEMFQSVNRFHSQVPFIRFVNGIRQFRTAFRGDLFVRVNLIDGMNADELYVIELAEFVSTFAAKAVIVGTAAIGGNQKAVAPVESVRLQYLASHFGPTARVVHPELDTISHAKEHVCL